MVSLPVYFALLGALCLERLVELWLSARNLRWALAQGGQVSGRSDFRLMVAVHAAFPFACALSAWRTGAQAPQWVSAGALGLAVAAQLLRYWAIFSLGRRWNTRIVVIPGAPPVVRGPYRFIRHPNYLAVAIELAAFPLIAGGWRTAVVFSLLNLALMWRRIPAEESALGPEYARAFAPRRRPEKGAEP
jgi:methyltransferase